MLTNDRNLSREQIQTLSDADAIAAFFLKLGYNVDGRIVQSTDALGITNTELQRQIRHVERIASQDGFLEVYLFEMRSLRVADRQALARTFRNLGKDFLFVLTADYGSLDFVLLERIAPDVPSEDGSPAMTRRQVLVRPRVLTVERQNPGPVALRVLRRFTYTETDPLAQYDKLLSAYTVAEWSEPLFNNRALFSDYYLKERLPGEPEWQEPRTASFRELQGLIAPARQRLASATEATTRAGLIEPVLDALGFTWIERRAPNESGDEPDYVLYAPDDDRPLAVCLAYVWNRYLDGTVASDKDPDTPDENPGAQVITLLERGEAPYAIVTNGKTWRLYAAGAHSRATNYYEIDLEETIASPEREDAFPYFWLFFRAQAFVPQEVLREGETRALSFLDRVQEGSEDYAVKLGESLKERVFEHIFQHFAEGFIASIRQREGQDAAIDQDRLDTIYQGTLTFLYRLMFLLYAESRALLPVQDVRGYYDISLEKLKREIAERAGNVQDEAPARLRKAYSADSFELYERLTALFKVIDQGDADRNVPRYNGGLFITEPGDGATQELLTARFLRDTPIPDRSLALGLDLLARDVDEHTKALAPIDFKSLGVRQLGSIYEGLLEFKLRIAPEKMAIVKGKRTEEIIPYAEAKKSKRRILTEGRGQNAAERTLPQGAVYLENTRQERKATGSYYTPDYIVKYIVAHTVGPVLDDKFAALTPRLRDAERRYHTAAQNARAKSQLGRTEDPEKFWNSDEMLRLAYDALDIKVLDPAMGSGHFLVEAVDYITDRMLNFLNGFPRNPVRAALERTRRAILDAMETQRVSIDQGRLNDVALLKRQVLKRCVYGVDLNPMAVELAKVSLWLDAFTLGAPLSFLDHHLRWGNSLIGAFDLSDVVYPGTERWNQIARAAKGLVEVGKQADATAGEVMLSKTTFEAARRDLIPTIERINVRLATHFAELGDTGPAEQYAYFPADVRAEQSTMTRQKFEQAQQIAAEMRFFHWKLEYPEVFIDPDFPRWKEIAGFDAVIGNPPYDVMEKAIGEVRPETLDSFANYLRRASIYEPAIGGKLNIFRFFVILWLHVLQSHGHFGLIVPLSIATDLGCSALRRWLITEHSLKHIDAFPDRYDPQGRVFSDAKTSVAILLGVSLPDPHNKLTIKTRSGASLSNIGTQVIVDRESVQVIDPEGFSFPTTSQEIWTMLTRIHRSAVTGRLKDIAVVGAGEVHLTYFKPYFTSNPADCEVIRGAELQRYFISDSLSQGEKLYLDLDAAIRGKLNPKRFSEPRIGMQRLTGTEDLFRILASVVDPGIFLAHTTQYVEVHAPYQIGYILGLLCSKLIDCRFRVTSGTTNVGVYELEQLPIRYINFTTPPDRRTSLVAQARDLYTRIERDGAGDLLAFTAERLAADETDVIHDLLAFLAEQMIDLNRQKQAEVKRFLGWLEGQIGASIDDLTGKTIIQGYLGDYQKGEGELPFADLYDRLQQNRRKLRANLSDKAVEARIAREYEASLGVLRPIKARLAHTDRLIDQIVYQLYGLTDEEIAIVEGRAS